MQFCWAILSMYAHVEVHVQDAASPVFHQSNTTTQALPQTRCDSEILTYCKNSRLLQTDPFYTSSHFTGYTGETLFCECTNDESGLFEATLNMLLGQHSLSLKPNSCMTPNTKRHTAMRPMHYLKQEDHPYFFLPS